MQQDALSNIFQVAKEKSISEWKIKKNTHDFWRCFEKVDFETSLNEIIG